MRISKKWPTIEELQNAVNNLEIPRSVYRQKVDEKECGKTKWQCDDNGVNIADSQNI